MRDQPPSRAAPEWRPQGWRRRRDALDPRYRRRCLDQLEPRVPAAERQQRRPVAIEAQRLDGNRVIDRRCRVEIAVDKGQEHLGAAVGALGDAARRVPIGDRVLARRAQAEKRLEGASLSVWRGGGDRLDRIHLGRADPARVRHHPVFGCQVVEADRLGPLAEQVDDRGAARGQTFRRRPRAPARRGAVQINEYFEMVPHPTQGLRRQSVKSKNRNFSGKGEVFSQQSITQERLRADTAAATSPASNPTARIVSAEHDDRRRVGRAGRRRATETE